MIIVDWETEGRYTIIQRRTMHKGAIPINSYSDSAFLVLNGTSLNIVITPFWLSTDDMAPGISILTMHEVPSSNPLQGRSYGEGSLGARAPPPPQITGAPTKKKNHPYIFFNLLISRVC